jgi:hypothetical protein
VKTTNDSIFELTDLDKFRTLIAERRKTIADKGSECRLQNSERKFPGIIQYNAGTYADDLTCSDEIAIPTGAIIEATGKGSYLVVSISKKNGFQVAQLLPVIGQLDLMAQRGGNYQKSGTVPIIKPTIHRDQLAVPLNQCPATGAVIRYNGKLYKIADNSRTSTCAYLELVPLQPVATPQTKHDHDAELRRFREAPVMPKRFEVMQWK